MFETQLPLWLAIPAAILLLTFPGFVTYNLAGRQRNSAGIIAFPVQILSLAENIFWSVALSAMLAGWVTLVLASLGVFSAWALLAVVGIWGVLAAGWLWKSGFNWQLPDFKAIFSKVTLQGWLLLALLAGTSALFFLAQHQTVVGGQDSGVYYTSAANIARTGKLVIDDPLLPVIGAQDPRNYPLLLQGMPGGTGRFLFVDFQRIGGYYIMDNLEGLSTGKVIPQFFHLFPALLAVGFSFFGLSGGLAVTPFLGILALFAVYLTTRRMLPGLRGEWTALLAGLLLPLNGIQVWFARETLWETSGEFLAFSGLYAFTLLVKPQPFSGGDKAPGLANLGGFGAGAAFGLLTLAHVSQAPVMLALLTPYFIWMRLTRRWGSGQWWMALTFGALLFHMVLHIRLFTLAYWEGIYHNVLRDYLYRLDLIIVAGTVGLLVLLVLDAMPGKMLALEGWIARRWRWIILGAGLVAALFLAYNYLIRIYTVGTDGRSNPYEYLLSWQSYIGAPTSQGPERNLLRLGWYFSPLGIGLAILGAFFFLARKFNGRSALFLALTTFFTYTFIDENYTQEGYIYSLRRYVNITNPAFSIFIAFALLYVLPDIGGWLEARLSKLFKRRLAVAPAAIGPQANITFAVVEAAPETKPVGATTTPGKSWRSGSRIGLMIGLALALFLALFFVWTNRTIYTHNEYGAGNGYPDLVSQLNNLAGKFGPKDILIFSGERDSDAKPATALTYIYNRPSFVLVQAPKPDELGAILDGWVKQGYQIKALLGPDGGRFEPTGYALKLTGEVTLNFHQFETLSTQKPYNVQDNQLTYGIYEVNQQKTSTGSGQGSAESATGWQLQIGKQDYAALVRGFYSLENDPNGAVYRWTGPEAVLRVPCLDPNTSHKLTVTVDPGVNRPAKAGPLTVKVSIGNDIWQDLTAVGSFSVQTGAQTYTLDLPAAGSNSRLTCRPGAGSLIIGFTSIGTWQPYAFGLSSDRRVLGIKLLSVKLTAN